MNNSLVEAIIGAIVLILTGYFLIFFFDNTSGRMGPNTYEVFAEFSQIGNISNGDNVRISGIKVGRVSSLDLNQENYYARASLRIRNGINIPIDSSVRVSTSAPLVGESYLEILVGAEDKFMENGDYFYSTQGGLDLINLISKILQ